MLMNSLPLPAARQNFWQWPTTQPAAAGIDGVLSGGPVPGVAVELCKGTPTVHFEEWMGGGIFSMSPLVFVNA